MNTVRAVDNTDWLKAVAIILVLIDHTGYFFIDNADWWSALGRMAAPPFFFLLGYAESRTVPMRWFWFGVILTLLDSANTDWIWVASNILLSLALIRLARPRVKVFLQRYGWVAIVLTIGAFLALMPLAGDAVEYGAEGWLWALLGLCQRMYVDGKQQGSESSARVATLALDSDPIYQGNEGLMRLAVCLVAAVVYVWQEQLEFSFPQVQFTAVIVGVAVMSVGMCLFRRGPSLIQPREPLAAVLRFVGRHTLEIYAIQLAGYEVIIMLLPDLAA